MQQLVTKIVRGQAIRYLKKKKPKVIVISGSVGKTSTTQAIATVLQDKFVIRKTLKNYNTQLGVSCSIFGSYFPSQLKNVFAWILLFAQHELQLIRKNKIEVLVLELGADTPGDIAAYDWLKPDIAVVTAVAPEHMDNFKTLEAVAAEELSVANYSQKTFINKEMVSSVFFKLADTEELYNYSREDLIHVGLKPADLQIIGEHSIDAVAAALSVGKELGMDTEKLRQGAIKIQPQPGRMNQLKGVSGSIIIDDTYNSSPEAAIAALDYIQSQPAPQRIVLLGNMNELGDMSAAAHKSIGEHCDPKKLDYVVTLGEDANNYTAAAAKQAGCKVKTTISPYEAAVSILSVMKPGAIVLCKGSQNGVFAEETVKQLLANSEDVSKLVRQDPFWLKKKMKSFKAAG